MRFPLAHWLLAPAAMAALLALTSCDSASSRTEIIVAVDTNLLVPDELDAVRVDMVGPGGELRRSMGALVGPDSLPASVGMIHTAGSLGPVQVTVVGSRAGMDVIQRRATVDFVPGETLVLWVHLVEECLNFRCPPDRTCAPGGCRPIAVEPSELRPWEGSLPRMDGGARLDAGVDGGGDACVSAPEACNGLDDDCDLAIDEEFDTDTDDLNCGACGNACPKTPPNASSTCSAGACVLVCDPGFEDCDGDATTGCESLLSAAATCGGCATVCEAPSPLCQGDPSSGFACVSTCAGGLMECDTVCADLDTDPLNCGGCGNVCTVGVRAAPVCVDGECGMACDPGFADCDGAPDTGCEASLTELDSCGACGAQCDFPSGMASCASGTCALVGCMPGFGDCDGDPATGCETDVASSLSSCGVCDNVCPDAPANSAAVCDVGMCGFRCDPGSGDCDMDASNGCESLLSDAATCGTCGISCIAPTPVCGGSSGVGFRCVESCAPPSEVCGTLCTDVVTDPTNCGACGTACTAAPQASAACAAGGCTIECDPGFGDCNASVGDGCERDLTTLGDCGACDAACTPANATGVCVGGACEVASCDMDSLDCDGDPANGCETDRSSMDNCGACGAVCPGTAANATSTSCVMGTCSLVCADGFGNCNGDVADGCETSLTADPNCGACGNACQLANAAATCNVGACEISMCDAGFDDCDSTTANGCEADLNRERRNCGVCGNDCGAGLRCCDGTCNSPPCP